jgi:SAM-dependent methyltransferase
VHDDPTSRASGWISTYSGQPLQQGEMDEWLEGSVERIARLGARHILEIGCGDGRLCRRIAPSCESYQAWDFSPAAVERCRESLSAAGLQQRTLTRVAEATALGDVPPRSVDLVILNSVVQYFPHAAYLEQVLHAALRAVRPGGHVFVGDVRNLRLHEAFAADVERTCTHASDADAWQALRRRCAAEPELLVAPESATHPRRRDAAQARAVRKRADALPLRRRSSCRSRP